MFCLGGTRRKIAKDRRDAHIVALNRVVKICRNHPISKLRKFPNFIRGTGVAANLLHIRKTYTTCKAKECGGCSRPQGSIAHIIDGVEGTLTPRRKCGVVWTERRDRTKGASCFGHKILPADQVF